MKKKSKGIRLVVNGETWDVVLQADDVTAYGDGMELGDGEKHNGIVIVDPGARRIVTGPTYTHEAFGTAVMHAIDVSTGNV